MTKMWPKLNCIWNNETMLILSMFTLRSSILCWILWKTFHKDKEAGRRCKQTFSCLSRSIDTQKEPYVKVVVTYNMFLNSNWATLPNYSIYSVIWMLRPNVIYNGLFMILYLIGWIYYCDKFWTNHIRLCCILNKDIEWKSSLILYTKYKNLSHLGHRTIWNVIAPSIHLDIHTKCVWLL